MFGRCRHTLWPRRSTRFVTNDNNVVKTTNVPRTPFSSAGISTAIPYRVPTSSSPPALSHPITVIAGNISTTTNGTSTTTTSTTWSRAEPRQKSEELQTERMMSIIPRPAGLRLLPASTCRIPFRICCRGVIRTRPLRIFRSNSQKPWTTSWPASLPKHKNLGLCPIDPRPCHPSRTWKNWCQW